MAQIWAAQLAEEEHFEILAAGSTLSFFDIEGGEAADVALAIALQLPQIPPFTCPIVVLSDDPDPGFPPRGKIHAWLPLDISLQELSAAIFAAACDLTVLTPQQLRGQRDHSSQNHILESPPMIETLTPRELQVLRMLADGVGNKQIAAQLGVSDHTAKFHVAQILAKLGATSRTEAVTIGIRRGLVPL